MPEVGEKRLDPDARVTSRICTVIEVTETHVIIRRGRRANGTKSRIRLDRWAKFRPLNDLGAAANDEREPGVYACDTCGSICGVDEPHRPPVACEDCKGVGQ